MQISAACRDFRLAKEERFTSTGASKINSALGALIGLVLQDERSFLASHRDCVLGFVPSALLKINSSRAYLAGPELAQEN
jgi:hypothetical protein